MSYRSLVLRAGVLAAAVTVAVFAFMTTAPAHKADAAGVQPSCTFATPIPQLIQQGGGADTATCTFTIHDVQHTLVVDFTVTLGNHPPVKIDACTLDANPIHVGPCP